MEVSKGNLQHHSDEKQLKSQNEHRHRQTKKRNFVKILQKLFKTSGFIRPGDHAMVSGSSTPKAIRLRCVYTLRLIGPISYPDECDLMVNPRKYIVMCSRMHFVTFVRI